MSDQPKFNREQAHFEAWMSVGGWEVALYFALAAFAGIWWAVVVFAAQTALNVTLQLNERIVNQLVKRQERKER